MGDITVPGWSRQPSFYRGPLIIGISGIAEKRKKNAAAIKPLVSTESRKRRTAYDNSST
jgi:hypothetical protein